MTTSRRQSATRSRDNCASCGKRARRARRWPGAAAGRAKAVLIERATVWTCGTNGVLTNAQVLVSGGKIERVGYLGEIKAASDTLMIDGQGSTSRRLDRPHSHTAVLGGVNESSVPSSAMVRISDVVNSETGNLYQQLAGGLPASTCSTVRPIPSRPELRYQAPRRRQPGRSDLRRRPPASSSRWARM